MPDSILMRRLLALLLALPALAVPSASAAMDRGSVATTARIAEPLATGSAFAGYGLAGFAPALFGASWSLNAAGWIAAVAERIVSSTALFGRRRYSSTAGTASLGRTWNDEQQ